MASVSQNAAATSNMPINNNQMVLTAHQMQLQLQKQAQLQQQQHQQNFKLSNNQMTASSLGAIGTTTSAAVVVTAHEPISIPLNATHLNPTGVEKITNSDGTTVLIGNNTNSNSIVNAVAAALQNKHRRRSTPSDINK